MSAGTTLASPREKATRVGNIYRESLIKGMLVRTKYGTRAENLSCLSRWEPWTLKHTLHIFGFSRDCLSSLCTKEKEKKGSPPYQRHYAKSKSGKCSEKLQTFETFCIGNWNFANQLHSSVNFEKYELLNIKEIEKSWIMRIWLPNSVLIQLRTSLGRSEMSWLIVRSNYRWSREAPRRELAPARPSPRRAASPRLH